MVSGDGPGGWRSIQYDLALRSIFRFSGSLPIIFMIRAHSGSASGCIRYTGPQTYIQDWFGTLTQGIAPDTYRGKRVRLSGFVQTDGVTHGAGLWMRIDGPAGVMGAFDNMMTRPVQGTTAWRKYGVVHDVPDNATQIAFGVLLIGHGIVWADDLALEIVGDEVPTTTVVTGP